MANEIKTMNIYEKLLSISTELKAVQKNLEVSMGKGKYKAVGEVDVLNAVKPLEAKYRIYSYPCDREVIESGTIDSKDYQGNEKRSLFERIKVTYRFVNVDNPSEFIQMVSYGDGIDNGDKSVGKAMTYADKYALLKAYKIMTGEDPDQEASEELNSVKTHNAPNRAKNTPNNAISQKPIDLLIQFEDALPQERCVAFHNWLKDRYGTMVITELTEEQQIEACQMNKLR